MEVLHYNLDMTPESEWKIVSAGAFARDKLLYLQEAGHFISGANYYTVRKELDSYLVKLTLSGAGILEYGGETYRLPAGSFFWIDCRAPAALLYCAGRGTVGRPLVPFYGATADAYYQAFLSQTQGRAAASLPVDNPVSAQMSALLARPGRDGGGLARDLDASALMTTILCGLIHGAAAGARSRCPQSFAEGAAVSARSSTRRKSRSIRSRRAITSANTTCSGAFQRYFGQSPGEYLTRLRLTRAKELLRATDLPVSEVAYRVGMENTSYFISVFRVRRRRYASAVPPPLVASGISAASSSRRQRAVFRRAERSSSRTGPMATL